jgi:hypothetical protein
MKKHLKRTLLVAAINGWAVWWLVMIALEKNANPVSLSVTIGRSVLVALLACGVLLDWLRPNWACVLNIAIWSYATVQQAIVAAYAQWAEEKIGFIFVVPITFFLAVVYLVSWREMKRVPA